MGPGRTAAVLLALGMAPPAGAAPAAPEPPLLGYCAPPVVPACLDGLKGRPEALPDCAARAERYEGSVFAYRACLARETERAVREANAAMAKLRCAQHRVPC